MHWVQSLIYGVYGQTGKGASSPSVVTREQHVVASGGQACWQELACYFEASLNQSIDLVYYKLSSFLLAHLIFKLIVGSLILAK